ncbi:MAG: molybdopterin-guanine dinucleotide biosynthesis protein B [Lachnospiraceae bacterium]|nr:molybdopterin-guanine dinucleotide biosynthesis protein B [Lachnospiraceae bacterium]
MGKNKALIQLNNERMIDRLIREFKGFDETLISANDRAPYEDTGCPVLPDEHKNIGPIEGLRQVIKAAGNEYVFVCACDMPFLSAELIEFVSEFISGDYDAYVIKSEDHIEPLCAIYSKAVLPVIEELIEKGEYRLRGILDRVRTKYISLKYTVFDEKVVKNINTKEELKEVREPYVFCVSGYANSGKTGLIEKLINEFIKDGHSVGVIKHDGCDHDFDDKDSDTGRFIRAGANAAAVFSDKAFLLSVREKTDEKKLMEFTGLLKSRADVIILEGFKESSYPKIEVIRSVNRDKALKSRENIICTVTDHNPPEDKEVPLFGHDDIRGIYLCLKKRFDL